ncbi:nucleotidyltransferase family protein [Gulosibacter molinativorax]|uniref:nucleotidyltransferase family protein n=1 Tax=Gulosibacter molinativorax TaxID=256821 RepID=UPI001FDEA36C|nr:nucleotidyltransferase domain-containing protein [Gulosibacter molinativorax]
MEAIARASEQFNVERLRVFGSFLSDRFNSQRSDVDILVDFKPGGDDPLADYFDLKFELERIFGREVDLVDASAVRNPYFKKSAFDTAQELYAA